MALKLFREEKREMAWGSNREHEESLPPFPVGATGASVISRNI